MAPRQDLARFRNALTPAGTASQAYPLRATTYIEAAGDNLCWLAETRARRLVLFRRAGTQYHAGSTGRRLRQRRHRLARQQRAALINASPVARSWRRRIAASAIAHSACRAAIAGTFRISRAVLPLSLYISAFW